VSHRLVTEATIRALEPGAILKVLEGTLITPAARDLASLRGIRIEPQAADPAASRGLRDGDRVDLPDGEWLLEVRDGRVRLRRIE